MSKLQINDISAVEGKIYGRKLWKQILNITSGAVSNPTKPLPAGTRSADIDKLASNAMYYVTSQFGGVQVMLKFESGEFLFAGMKRDAKGAPIAAKDHKYSVDEVEATRRFDIPDSDGKYISAGFRTFKATPLV